MVLSCIIDDSKKSLDVGHYLRLHLLTGICGGIVGITVFTHVLVISEMWLVPISLLSFCGHVGRYAHTCRP